MGNDGEKLGILVATTDAGALASLRWVLQDEYRLKVSDPTLEGCLRAIETHRPSLVIFDLELFDELEAVQDLEQVVDTPSVGAVAVLVRPEREDWLRAALVAGARQYLYMPLDRKDLAETVGRMARRHRMRRSILRKGDIPGAGLWAFCGPRDGVGKSTLLFSLASELLTLGRDVLVVDLDLHFGDLAFMADLPQEGANIATLLEAEGHGERAVVEKHVHVHGSGMRFLLPPANLEEAYGVDLGRAVELVRGLTPHYDFVLVDLPAGVPDLTLPVLDEARFVFVTSNGDPAVFRNLRRLIDVLLGLGYTPDKIRPVLTAYRDGQIQLRDFERVLTRAGLSMAHVFPRDEEAAAQSLRAGQAVSRVAPKSPFADSVRDFLLPILRIAPEEAADKGPRSFLRKLFG